MRRIAMMVLVPDESTFQAVNSNGSRECGPAQPQSSLLFVPAAPYDVQGRRHATAFMYTGAHLHTLRP